MLGVIQDSMFMTEGVIVGHQKEYPFCEETTQHHQARNEKETHFFSAFTPAALHTKPLDHPKRNSALSTSRELPLLATLI